MSVHHAGVFQGVRRSSPPNFLSSARSTVQLLSSPLPEAVDSLRRGQRRDVPVRDLARLPEVRRLCRRCLHRHRAVLTRLWILICPGMRPSACTRPSLGTHRRFQARGTEVTIGRSLEDAIRPDQRGREPQDLRSTHEVESRWEKGEQVSVAHRGIFRGVRRSSPLNSLSSTPVSDFGGTMTRRDFYQLAIRQLLPPAVPDHSAEFRRRATNVSDVLHRGAFPLRPRTRTQWGVRFRRLFAIS